MVDVVASLRFKRSAVSDDGDQSIAEAGLVGQDDVYLPGKPDGIGHVRKLPMERREPTTIGDVSWTNTQSDASASSTSAFFIARSPVLSFNSEHFVGPKHSCAGQRTAPTSRDLVVSDQRGREFG